MKEDKGQRVVLEISDDSGSARRPDSGKLARDSEDEFDEDEAAASEDGALD